MKLKSEISRKFSIEQCRLNFRSLFVFGDNLLRVGMGGQAIIREQPNAIGICTKLKPSMEEDAFFTDKEYEENCKIIDKDIDNIKAYAEEKKFISVVFPQNGLGTGLAQMPLKAPLTFCYLTEQLIKHFNFNNLYKFKDL